MPNNIGLVTHKCDKTLKECMGINSGVVNLEGCGRKHFRQKLPESIVVLLTATDTQDTPSVASSSRLYLRRRFAVQLQRKPLLPVASAATTLPPQCFVSLFSYLMETTL